jgi:hypothetical protein
MRKPFREAELFEMLHKHLGVRFLYETHGEGVASAIADGPQDPAAVPSELVDALAALPADWLADLREATVQADWDRILRWIDRIRGQNGPLADGLTDLANDFQYREMMKLIELAEKES